MISRITVFVKKSDMEYADFFSYMENTHAKLYEAVAGLYSYEHNYVFLKEKGDASSESVIADAISIERYETLHEYECAKVSAAYMAIEEDIGNFAELTESFVCLENVSIPRRETDSFKKKITLLGRIEGKVSFEDFTREWFVVHSGCMLNMPKEIFYGYNQHLIIDRSVNGKPADYSTLPYDGILELYYSDPAEVANAFASSPEGRYTVSHRKEFMSSVNPFQVNNRVFK